MLGLKLNHVSKTGQWYLSQWCHMVTLNWDNIGSGNGLLPDGTKTFPEPMLINHHERLVAFTGGNYSGNAQDMYHKYEFENHHFDITVTSPSDQWVNISVRTPLSVIDIDVYLIYARTNGWANNWGDSDFIYQLPYLHSVIVYHHVIHLIFHNAC